MEILQKYKSYFIAGGLVVFLLLAQQACSRCTRQESSDDEFNQAEENYKDLIYPSNERPEAFREDSPPPSPPSEESYSQPAEESVPETHYEAEEAATSFPVEQETQESQVSEPAPESSDNAQESAPPPQEPEEPASVEPEPESELAPTNYDDGDY